MCAKNRSDFTFNIDDERRQKIVSLVKSNAYAGVEKKLLAIRKDIEIKKALDLLNSARLIGREPNYRVHAVRVALYYARFGNPVTVRGLVLSVLHNVLEVTDLSKRLLEEVFDLWLRQSCEALIVDRESQNNDPSYTKKYYDVLNRQSAEVQQIKIFDKLDNLLVLFLNPSEAVRRKYLSEIDALLLPIIRKQTPALESVFLKLCTEVEKMPHQTAQQFLTEYSKNKMQ